MKGQPGIRWPLLLREQVVARTTIGFADVPRAFDQMSGSRSMAWVGGDERLHADIRGAAERHRGMTATQLISTNASGRISSVTPTAVHAGYGASRNSAATLSVASA